jgi:hypothetical protein
VKKVVLIGDSIRMGYQPLVQSKATEFEVWGPAANCRHSLCALENFQQWVADQTPDIVHCNFGIHDASIQPDGDHQILLPQYRLSLQRFISKIQLLPGTRMIWGTTTPLYTAQPDVPMAAWPVREAAELDIYGAAALEIVTAAGLPVNDLHAAILHHDFSKCLREDGCHMTEFGNEVLSDAVVATLRALG